MDVSSGSVLLADDGTRAKLGSFGTARAIKGGGATTSAEAEEAGEGEDAGGRGEAEACPGEGEVEEGRGAAGDWSSSATEREERMWGRR